MTKTIYLKRAAEIVTDRCTSDALHIDDYVSTENILPNKAGLIRSSRLPPQGNNLPAYRANDILISNIRPYLKKIWFADRSGACSADVLTLRAKPEIEPKFLYYALFRDDFFAHAMKGAKGTKMPRGDKTQLLDFSIPNLVKAEQQKIAFILSSLDAKIDCNIRINAELDAMVKTLYDYWFVQFNFPDANGKPYKSSGGKMVYNATLKREIPQGWGPGQLGQFISLERGVTYGKEDVCTSSIAGAIGVLRATNVTGNVVDADDLVYVHASRVSPTQTISKFSTLIVMSSGSKDHVGKNGIYFFNEPLGFGAFCSKITPDSNARYFVNTFLQSFWFKVYIKNQCLGTNINNLTNDHINDCPIISPNEEILRRFEDAVKAQYETMAVNVIENQQLAQLRDWLLPMLMNGQVVVNLS